ncbi:hypothetical protein F4775DRAFT_592494 [Biscogniauxia sp. FL1348]|nr:hypothetical protein F4775DRAFT_592494 [Biscogniauxia sp. FL1348]
MNQTNLVASLWDDRLPDQSADREASEAHQQYRAPGGLSGTIQHEPTYLAWGLCRSVIVTCRYTVAPSRLRQQHQQQPLKSVVENALARVMMRHGILCVGIAGEDTKAPRVCAPEDDRSPPHGKRCPSLLLQIAETGSFGDSSDRWDELSRGGVTSLLCWEDLAQKLGWKIVIHHDPRQIRTGAAYHSPSTTPTPTARHCLVSGHTVVEGSMALMGYVDDWPRFLAAPGR